jgi:hypothetical protein
VRECPLPRIPWCVHCRNNTHATEECPEVISKWEGRARKRGVELINYEPRTIADTERPNINIITRRGAKISANAESPHQLKVQKAIPEKYQVSSYVEK